MHFFDHRESQASHRTLMTLFTGLQYACKFIFVKVAPSTFFCCAFRSPFPQACHGRNVLKSDGPLNTHLSTAVLKSWLLKHGTTFNKPKTTYNYLKNSTTTYNHLNNIYNYSQTIKYHLKQAINECQNQTK